MSIIPCPPSSAPVTGVVVFDPTAFKAAFPSFTTVADAALSLSFSLATLQLTNSCGSRVSNAVERETLLNLLVAHITALKDGENGDGPPGVVGRIDKATEGSVSVSAVMDTSGVYGKDWYAQTRWGAMYWASTAKYRTAVYIPAPLTCADINGGLGFPGGFWPNNGGGCGC